MISICQKNTFKIFSNLSNIAMQVAYNHVLDIKMKFKKI